MYHIDLYKYLGLLCMLLALCFCFHGLEKAQEIVADVISAVVAPSAHDKLNHPTEELNKGKIWAMEMSGGGGGSYG